MTALDILITVILNQIMLLCSNFPTFPVYLKVAPLIVCRIKPVFLVTFTLIIFFFFIFHSFFFLCLPAFNPLQISHCKTIQSRQKTNLTFQCTWLCPLLYQQWQLHTLFKSSIFSVRFFISHLVFCIWTYLSKPAGTVISWVSLRGGNVSLREMKTET